VQPWYLVICGLVALALLFWGLRSLRRKRLIENVPTSKVKAVFMGLNEVKGRARSDAPLTSYLAHAACVYYEYKVQEHWSRTVTYTDSKGKTQTRHESGWTTVASEVAAPPFDLEDDTGRLRVVPAGAEIEAIGIFDHTCGRSDPLYYGKGPDGAVSNSDHRRRFTEHAIRVGDRVYVIGCARLREDRVEPEIARDRDAELFLISTRSEEQILSGYGYKAFFPLLLGTAAAFLFPVGLSLENRGFVDALRLEASRSLAIGGGYLGFVALMYLVFVYNGLAEVKRRAQMAWSMIEVQLKRRNDLVPRLVAVVKGYARHEEETQRLAAALRVEGSRRGGKRAAGEEASRQGRALREVIALAEAYPDLRANALFGRLQAELTDTEDRIAFAREFYNAAVTALNNRRDTMPDALVARLTGLRRGEYFAAEGLERASVRVNL
jgi:hypothetical protein